MRKAKRAKPTKQDVIMELKGLLVNSVGSAKTLANWCYKRDVMIGSLVKALESANRQYAYLQRFVREHGEQCRKQRKIDSDFIHDVQMCMAQGQDTLCGSRWMNVAGLRMAFQRKADAEEKGQ